MFANHCLTPLSSNQGGDVVTQGFHQFEAVKNALQKLQAAVPQGQFYRFG